MERNVLGDSMIAKPATASPSITEEVFEGFISRLDFAKYGILPHRCLRKLEQEMIRQALALVGGNVCECARVLGLRRDQLRYKLGIHGLRGKSRPRVQKVKK